jgi:hypothetical protein
MSLEDKQVSEGKGVLKRFKDNGDGTHSEVVSVGGAAQSSVTITRPSNTTDYAANDVLGVANSGTPANAGSAILEFIDIGSAGANVLITNVSLAAYVSALPSGMTTFRLHLYSASPTAILDNAAWDLVAGDRAAYLGYVDIEQMVDVGSTLYVQTNNAENATLPKQVKLADGSSSLFGLLVTNGGFTPSSGSVKKLTLSAVMV